jgi:hypothetical protein
VLEDTSGRVVVGGSSQDRIEGSDVLLRWRSPGVGYAAGAGAPPSRGASCSTPKSPACTLTDGDLVTSSGVTASPATIMLRRPVGAELVVVRGCDGTCAVAVSGDRVAFRDVGVASGPFATVALDGAPVAAVRVTGGSTAPLELREVSVWGPRPAGPALLGTGDGLGTTFGGGAAESRRTPILIAALLVAVVLFLAGLTVGRRRGSTP